MKLSVGKIVVDPARRTPDPEKVGGMADSLQSIGQLYPILVHRVNDEFVLVDGGLRLDAALADLGYGTTSLEVLNAADYGVPQDRKRAIIVANPWGLPNPYPGPILAEPFHRTVASAIGDLRGLPQGALPNHEWPNPGVRKRSRIAALSHGEPLYPNFTGCSRRLWPDRPAYTVTANNGQPHIHPHEDRFISVREMARLQGFPDSFVFEGSVSETQRQVANAIPPPLAEHVALALRPLLRSVHGHGRTADRASASGARPGNSIDWWTGRFHRGDCVELMGQMPERSVGLIVTSPPYNIRNSTGNGMKGRAGGKRGQRGPEGWLLRPRG